MPSLDWLAGIVEGEGCFLWSKGSKTNKPAPKLQVKMTDADVMQKVADMFGNKMTRTKPNGLMRKDYYTVAKNNIPAIVWMLTLFPLMGNRRRSKISELLCKWEHGEA